MTLKNHSVRSDESLMFTLRSRLTRNFQAQDGFTVVETMVAVAILIIAIVLTTTPMMISMRSIDRSKEVTVAENLAQGQIEEIRSLEYGDVGVPGFAPDGIVPQTEVKTVEGRTYTISTEIRYVGAATGLNIVPQGGDGVEGVFDPGVNYKQVVVIVTPDSERAVPQRMETIMSPPTIGALETVALVEVTIDRHEPYDPYIDPTPNLQLQGTAFYLSFDTGEVQLFPDVDADTYDITLFSPFGWLMHPDTTTTGADVVLATEGILAQRTIRVYRPADLTVTVVDKDTGVPIPDATLSALNMTTLDSTANGVGDYFFPGLIPNRHEVAGTAPGYSPGTVEVEVPGFGGGDSATATLELEVFVPPPWTPVDYTFDVDYGNYSGYHTAGADVVVTHPTFGVFAGVTDEFGKVTLGLPENETGFSFIASSPWGHIPDSGTFNTGSTPVTRYEHLTNTSGGFDRWAMRYGPDGPSGFYEYRKGSGPWVRVPGNSIGRASFVLSESAGTQVRIRTYCSLADYPTWDVETVYTMNNFNKVWSVPGSSC